MTIMPAMQGKMGTTVYWLVCMKAKQVSEKLELAPRLPEWEGLSPDEKFQRDLKLPRIKKIIAPYFATDKRRFTGSLIVALKGGNPKFEPVKEITEDKKQFKGDYETRANHLGFLKLDDSEVFIAIDGQHRALALKYAMSGRDHESGKDLDFSPNNDDLPMDDIVLILFRFETEKARYIFNKVNQYAKPTGKGDNLITDDDDQIAVASRNMLNRDKWLQETIHPDLVRSSSNTLGAGAKEFTTLATLNAINKEIVERNLVAKEKLPNNKFEAQSLNEAQKRLIQKEIEDTWKDLLENVLVFKTLTADLSKEGDAIRTKTRAENLLGKPIGQSVYVSAYLRLLQNNWEKKKAFDMLNKLDWSIDAKHWRPVIIREDGKVNTGTVVINSGAGLAVYLSGGMPNKEEQEKLQAAIAGKFGQYKLPPISA